MPAALATASRPGRTLPKTRVWGFDLPDPSMAPGEPPVLAAFSIWPGAGVTTTTRRAVPDYLRARYYDPATGQFISRDPLVALTRQPYAYVGDNPLNGTDPTGLYNCGWQPWNCVQVPTSVGQAWDQFSSNVRNPQTLVIAGGAGLIAGAAAAGCLFGGCEAAAGALGIGGGVGAAGVAGAAGTAAPTLENEAGPVSTALSGLEAQACAHAQKLLDYMSNPLESDNQGTLANAINHGVGNPNDIYNGRISSLLGQVNNFLRQIGGH